MKVLIACEESQRICIEARAHGHEAYSCDISDPSGGHPEWHIKGDALKVLRGGCDFVTVDGATHTIEGHWDLVIAHPPCTYMSNAGACRLYPRKGELDYKRFSLGLQGKLFFMVFWLYGWFGVGKIAIENPIPSRVFELPKHTQAIQPYEFGDPYTKKTYLWLFGLPKLVPTNVVEPIGPYVCGNADIWKKQAKQGVVHGKEKSSRHRSKTFDGISRAIVSQWMNDAS